MIDKIELVDLARKILPLGELFSIVADRSLRDCVWVTSGEQQDVSCVPTHVAANAILGAILAECAIRGWIVKQHPTTQGLVTIWTGRDHEMFHSAKGNDVAAWCDAFCRADDYELSQGKVS
jgi:hypothetical protein